MTEEELLKRADEIMEEINPNLLSLSLSIIENEDPRIALMVITNLGVNLCSVATSLAVASEMDAEKHGNLMFHNVMQRHNMVTEMVDSIRATKN